MNAAPEWLAAPWVEVLGRTLLHFLWQGAVLGALAWVALRFAHKRSAKVRYLLAGLLMLALPVLPVVTFLILSKTPPSLPPAPRVFVANGLPDNAPTPTGPIEAPVTLPVQTLPMPKLATVTPPLTLERTAKLATWWMVPFWLAGVLCMAARLGLGWLRIQKWQRSATPTLNAALLASFQRLSKKFDLGKRVRLLISQAIPGPVTYGWIRPAVLLPAQMLTGLPPELLEALLAHELAHIARQDYLANLVQSAIEVVLFYHPTVWWLSARVREIREECCDELAVQACGDRLTYARALESLAELQLAAEPAAAASGGNLLARITRIVGRPTNAPTSSARNVAGLFILTGFVVGLAVFLSPVHLQAQAQAPKVADKPAVKSDQDANKAEAEKLIDELVNVSTETAFVNTKASTMSKFLANDLPPVIYTGLAQEVLPPTPAIMRKIVEMGVAAVPSLLDHLTDARETKLVIRNPGAPPETATYQGVFTGAMWYSDEYDPRYRDNPARAPQNVNTVGKSMGDGGPGPGTTYTVRVGDLCYVLLGQIVDRNLVAVRYQGTSCAVINSPVHTPALAAAARQDWAGLTAEQHQASLEYDLASDAHARLQMVNYRTQHKDASERLGFYYPEAAKAAPASTSAQGQDQTSPPAQATGRTPHGTLVFSAAMMAQNPADSAQIVHTDALTGEEIYSGPGYQLTWYPSHGNPAPIESQFLFGKQAPAWLAPSNGDVFSPKIEMVPSPLVSFLWDYGQFATGSSTTQTGGTKKLLDPARSVTVLGEVKKTLVAAIDPDAPLTLSQAITQAGWTPYSSHTVELTRHDKDGYKTMGNYDVDEVLVNGHKDQDVPLLPGDIITVKRNWQTLPPVSAPRGGKIAPGSTPSSTQYPVKPVVWNGNFTFTGPAANTASAQPTGSTGQGTLSIKAVPGGGLTIDGTTTFAAQGAGSGNLTLPTTSSATSTTPQGNDAAVAPDQVEIETYFVEYPSKVKFEPSGGSYKLNDYLDQLDQQAPDANVIKAPKITVLAGKETTIQASQPGVKLGGTEYTGHTLGVGVTLKCERNGDDIEFSGKESLATAEKIEGGAPDNIVQHTDLTEMVLHGKTAADQINVFQLGEGKNPGRSRAIVLIFNNISIKQSGQVGGIAPTHQSAGAVFYKTPTINSAAQVAGKSAPQTNDLGGNTAVTYEQSNDSTIPASSRLFRIEAEAYFVEYPNFVKFEPPADSTSVSAYKSYFYLDQFSKTPDIQVLKFPVVTVLGEKQLTINIGRHSAKLDGTDYSTLPNGISLAIKCTRDGNDIEYSAKETVATVEDTMKTANSIVQHTELTEMIIHGKSADGQIQFFNPGADLKTGRKRATALVLNIMSTAVASPADLHPKTSIGLPSRPQMMINDALKLANQSQELPRSTVLAPAGEYKFTFANGEKAPVTLEKPSVSADTN